MSKELKEYREKFENELFNILEFWKKYGLEKEGKGFYGAVDIDNKPVLSANKTCVLNARILWTFAAAAKAYPGKGYEEMAHLAYKVVTEDFADKDFGGYYMELSSSNEVVNDIKHTYAQAFVIYALSKYYKFNPQEEVLKKIQDFFHFLDDKTKDPDNPGYLESFTRNWEIYEENRMADNNEPKSMNTHLHVLEAYAAVYKVWKGELVRQRLTDLLQIFVNNIIRDTGHLGVFFTSGMEETETSKGICSPGAAFSEQPIGSTQKNGWSASYLSSKDLLVIQRFRINSGRLFIRLLKSRGKKILRTTKHTCDEKIQFVAKP